MCLLRVVYMEIVEESIAGKRAPRRSHRAKGQAASNRTNFYLNNQLFRAVVRNPRKSMVSKKYTQIPIPKL